MKQKQIPLNKNDTFNNLIIFRANPFVRKINTRSWLTSICMVAKIWKNNARRVGRIFNSQRTSCAPRKIPSVVQFRVYLALTVLRVEGFANVGRKIRDRLSFTDRMARKLGVQARLAETIPRVREITFPPKIRYRSLNVSNVAVFELPWLTRAK